MSLEPRDPTPEPSHALVAQLGVHEVDGAPLVDTRNLARPLGVKHPSLYRLLVVHRQAIEVHGQIRFEIEVVKGHQGGGNPRRFALLNFDQACLLASLAQNTAEAVIVKTALSVAFRECRRWIAQHLQHLHDWEHAKRVHHDAAASEAKGSIGGRLMAERRYEKPQFEQALAELTDVLQLKLPWSQH